MIPVQYVGKKTPFRDHIAGTKLEWQPGETREIPPEAAGVLLKYSTFKASREDLVPFEWEVPAEVEEEEDAVRDTPLADLNAMTKAQLKQYAHRNFGVVLDRDSRKEDMVDAIQRQAGKRNG